MNNEYSPNSTSDDKEKTLITLVSLNEKISSHIEKLRDSVDESLDFSLHESLQNTFQESWQSLKPPSLIEVYKNQQIQRNPVPLEALEDVVPLGFDACIRTVGNGKLSLNFADETINVLTLSAGGAKGAYGAGVLAGWAERDDMPIFDVVMGVSTGAIIALFAFVGQLDVLHDFYNHLGTEDLVEKRGISGIATDSSLYDNTKLIALINDYIDDVMVRRLADEADKGRVLLVGTTNLDRGLPVTWDIGKIAQTNNPLARQLIADIFQSSCAIPVVFPPVILPVTDSQGNEYDELHVDGAASLQMLIEVPVSNATIYAIANKSLVTPYHPADAEILDIGTKTISSTLASSIIGELYRLYTSAQHRGNVVHATWVPETFQDIPTELFDRNYMQKLYALGNECARLGRVWHEKPPYLN